MLACIQALWRVVVDAAKSVTFSQFLANVKILAEIVAYASGAAFFLWKLRSGYLIVNAAIKVDVNRVARDSTTDYLAVSATLLKRGIGSLILQDARARLTYSGTVVEVELAGYERLSSRADAKVPSRTRLVFGTQSRTVPFLFLTPEEEATFSAYAEIPKSAPCLVEVAVSGKRVGRQRVGQWRSSVVSLPNNEVETPRQRA
jgi:hypothetical protein